ncbi:hypothetical protein [Streptomyces sp. NPDC047718]|uniref:hypothetical protein n=1 Tax=Streptomyces sp. NPDC047718 TaxID=3155479 RepID=UPI0033CA91C1
MADLGTFISQDFGSVASAVVALLAIPGVIVAGHIQGSKALKGAEAQAKKALEAAQAQAAATLETGRLQAQAAVASARELSRETHAQWQRDRCQEVWAEYVKELDVLLPKKMAAQQESRAGDLLKAFAMVELLSPPNVLREAQAAKDGALSLGVLLYAVHLDQENSRNLRDEKRRLRGMVAEASRLVRATDGSIVERVQVSADEWEFVGPDSPDEVERMLAQYEQGAVARAALDAIAESEDAPGDESARERTHRALVDAGVRESVAAALAHTAALDRVARDELVVQRRTTLNELRDAFVETAHKELDVLGR